MPHSSEKKEEIRQKDERMMDFIETYIARNRYPPTVREIQAALGIASLAQVVNGLNRLEKDGYIQREKYISRGIRLTAKRMLS